MSTGKGVGQPSKCSPELARRIAGLVRNGVRLADAAERCGIDRSSLFNWRKWGKAGQEPYATFEKIIKAAALAGKSHV